MLTRIDLYEPDLACIVSWRPHGWCFLVRDTGRDLKSIFFQVSSKWQSIPHFVVSWTSGALSVSSIRHQTLTRPQKALPSQQAIYASSHATW
jgi:hypothetical protein